MGPIAIALLAILGILFLSCTTVLHCARMISLWSMTSKYPLSTKAAYICIIVLAVLTNPIIVLVGTIIAYIVTYEWKRRQ